MTFSGFAVNSSDGGATISISSQGAITVPTSITTASNGKEYTVTFTVAGDTSSNSITQAKATFTLQVLANNSQPSTYRKARVYRDRGKRCGWYSSSGSSR